jgi:hypothetical protein
VSSKALRHVSEFNHRWHFKRNQSPQAAEPRWRVVLWERSEI